jgi:hypothetical protein
MSGQSLNLLMCRNSPGNQWCSLSFEERKGLTSTVEHLVRVFPRES